MAVTNIKRTLRELGRIRMGERGDRGQPKRLSHFRLTSQDRSLLEAAARLYGGTVQPWEKSDPPAFELYTEKAELPCMIAPMEVSQHYELWSGGGCQRRCTSEVCEIPGKDGIEQIECPCDPENRECKLTTRLSVFLSELPGMGVWRLETHGYYAATELPATAEMLINLARNGRYEPAILAIEQREVKRPGQPTKKFPVPTLRVGVTLQTLMTGEVPSAPALEAPKAALPEPTKSTAAPAKPAATAATPPDHRRAAVTKWQQLTGTRGSSAEILASLGGALGIDPPANNVDVTPDQWQKFGAYLEQHGLPAEKPKPTPATTDHRAAALALYDSLGGNSKDEVGTLMTVSDALDIDIPPRYAAVTPSEWERWHAHLGEHGITAAPSAGGGETLDL